MSRELIARWRERVERRMDEAYRYPAARAAITRCADELEDTLALSPPPVEPPAWQPIATAPKQSRMIMVAARATRDEPLTTMFAYWNDQHAWWYQLYAHELRRIYPTHWMPLPAPPVSPPPTEDQ